MLKGKEILGVKYVLVNMIKCCCIVFVMWVVIILKSNTKMISVLYNYWNKEYRRFKVFRREESNLG